MSQEKPPETWRDIPGYPGYRVSNQGRVVSLWRRINHDWIVVSDRPKLLRQTRNDNGYIMFRLNRDGKQRLRSLHILVLEAFVGPRPPGLEGRHLDDDKDNNQPANLEWGTRSQNMQDRVVHGLDGISKLTPETVHEVRRLLDLGVTQRKIAAQFHLNQSTVSNIKTGKSWGYV